MSNSYPFTTYSGLLTPEHYKRIGSAIWLFLWCVSSTTKEVEKDGVVWGIVLGNKPHKVIELADLFGVNEKTVRRWVKDLETHEYIRVTRAPYGLILTVKNSKRGFHKRSDKNVRTETDRTKMSEPERTKMSEHPDKNVRSNKDITEISNITTAAEEENDPIDIIANRYIDLRSAQKGRPVYPTSDDYAAIAQIVARGMPLPQTIKWLEDCFEKFNQRKPNGEIKSFNYCVSHIIDRYEAEIAKQKAKEAAVKGEVQNGSINRGSNQQAARKDSITGGETGWIGRNRRKRA